MHSLTGDMFFEKKQNLKSTVNMSSQQIWNVTSKCPCDQQIALKFAKQQHYEDTKLLRRCFVCTDVEDMKQEPNLVCMKCHAYAHHYCWISIQTAKNQKTLKNITNWNVVQWQCPWCAKNEKHRMRWRKWRR